MTTTQSSEVTDHTVTITDTIGDIVTARCSCGFIIANGAFITRRFAEQIAEGHTS